MSNVYIYGDLHLGHKNIVKFRDVESEEEQYEILKEKYHSKVTKRDTVIFLGDTCFTKQRLLDLATWQGRKINIIGNHDMERGITFRDFVGVYDNVYSLLSYKGFWLSHAPIHQDEIRNKWGNIHGHCHDYQVDDARYLCLSLEHTNGYPILFEEAKERIAENKIKYEKYGSIFVKE